jgi:hypothetical protein
MLVEPVTGAIVDTVSAEQSYSVQPDFGHLAAVLVPILTAHKSNPAAARLLAAAGKLAGTRAQPLYSLTYHQTAASVAAAAGTAGHDAMLLGIVRVWIPVILGVLGLVLAGRKSAHVAELRSGAGSIPASREDFPDGGGGGLYPGHQQFAVCPAVPSPGFLAGRPQYQGADRVHGARPARSPGPGPPGVPARDQIAVPAEHGIRAHRQVQVPGHVPREPVQQRRQQCPVSRGEPCPVRAELPLRDQELVAQREDLGVFVLAAHR